MDEIIYPDAQVSTICKITLSLRHNDWFSKAHELDGKRPSQSIIEKMAYAHTFSNYDILFIHTLGS